MLPTAVVSRILFIMIDFWWVYCCVYRNNCLYNVIFYNTVIGEAIKGNRIAVMSCSENVIIQDLDIFRSNYPNCRYVWKVWFNLQVWNDCIICKILIWYVIVVYWRILQYCIVFCTCNCQRNIYYKFLIRKITGQINSIISFH